MYNVVAVYIVRVLGHMLWVRLQWSNDSLWWNNGCGLILVHFKHPTGTEWHVVHVGVL